mmetsp:Transcript_65588/g.182366  ORF Transcript_65588/g.182366 Transcript_65588/m.182366 type:complete len:202 (-) Transcript_65588:373-978(-)
MLLVYVRHRVPNSGELLRVGAHFRLHVVPRHVEEGEVRREARRLERQDVRRVLRLHAPEPVEVPFQPSRRGVRPIQSIVKEALPLEERKVPRKVPHPQSTAPVPQRRPEVRAVLAGQLVRVSVSQIAVQRDVDAESFGGSCDCHFGNSVHRDRQKESSVDPERLPQLFIEAERQRHLHGPVHGLVQEGYGRFPHPYEAERL